MNEHGEYLTYFPEDSKHFQPYILSLDKMLAGIESVWHTVKGIEDQKEFALEVAKYPYSSCLFQAKKSGKHPIKCFHEQTDSFKAKVLSSFIGG